MQLTAVLAGTVPLGLQVVMVGADGRTGTKHPVQNTQNKTYGTKHAKEIIRSETNAEDNTRNKQAEHTQKQTNYNTRNKAYAKQKTKQKNN